MNFNTLTDQLLFRLSKNELETSLYEITNSKRQNNTDKEIKSLKDFGKLNPIINKFISIFYKNFSKEQTIEMLHRLNDLEIEMKPTKKKRFSTTISLGSYDNINNKIIIPVYDDKKIPFDLEKTLMHELLHMASTRDTDKGPITGLEIPSFLGLNFNEKYTDYLLERYFTDTDYLDSDNEMLLVIKGLEFLIGKEKLQECYFNANIGELFTELEKYSNKQDILKLFYLIDKMDTPTFSYKDHRSIIREIAKMNVLKLSTLLHKKEITREEYDIEYARICEYRNFILWSEEAEVIKDKDSFIFKEKDNTSELYTFIKMNGDSPLIEKKY